MSVIYSILCKKNNKRYIGSTCNFLARKTSHLGLLRHNKHTNKELQADFNQYGEQEFEFIVLESCQKIELLEKEEFWRLKFQNIYNSPYPIYNKIVLNKKQIKLFWAKINKKSDHECWIWTGAKDKDGYGRIGFYNNGRKNMYRSNRLAYFLTYPQSDYSLLVRHTCNNSSCCNPKHLILGTSSDNAHDRVMSNRGTNKLSYDIANKIRQYYLQGIKKSKDLQQLVLDKYKIKISVTCLNKVLNNSTFYNNNWLITNRQYDRQYHADESPTAQLNWNIINDIRKMYNANIKNKEIQFLIEYKYGRLLNTAYISNIALNKVWFNKNYHPNKKYKVK